MLAKAARATLAAGSARFSSSVRTTPRNGKTVIETSVGSQDFSKRTVRAVVASSEGRASAEARLIGTVAYFEEPGVDRTKPWSKLDFAGVGIESGLDPSAQLAGLATALSGQRDLGPVTVGGVPTTHWSATVDLVKAAGPGDLAALQVRSSGATTAHLDAYLDAKGRYRRLVQTSVLPKYSTHLDVPSGPATVVSTLDYTDFGVPVTVTPPPASQVGPVR